MRGDYVRRHPSGFRNPGFTHVLLSSNYFVVSSINEKAELSNVHVIDPAASSCVIAFSAFSVGGVCIETSFGVKVGTCKLPISGSTLQCVRH